MRTWLTAIVAAISALGTSGCGLFYPPLDVVAGVNVEQYMGRWYEIARYPNSFQDADCIGTTADYTLRTDGKVTVVNTCYQGSLDGPVDSIEGVARVADTTTNAKLKVTFFPPFEGNYWIIDLDTDGYRWAVVGEPSRRFLWILSRTPTMATELYDAILARLPDKQYDPNDLVLTLQATE